MLRPYVPPPVPPFFLPLTSVSLGIITYVGAKWTPISPKWVTAIFVTVDVVSFCVQGAGGSLYSSDNVSIYPTAKAVLLVGFIIQVRRPLPPYPSRGY